MAQNVSKLLTGCSLCCEREFFDFCRKSPRTDVSLPDIQVVFSGGIDKDTVS